MTRTRRSDPEWLRMTAAKPLSLRQPLYEATRMLEIAARLESLLAENTALRTFLELSIQFMDAQGKDDLGTMVTLSNQIADVVAKLNGPNTEFVTTELEAILPASGSLQHALVTGAATVERPSARSGQDPAIDPANVVDADSERE